MQQAAHIHTGVCTTRAERTLILMMHQCPTLPRSCCWHDAEWHETGAITCRDDTAGFFHLPHTYTHQITLPLVQAPTRSCTRSLTCTLSHATTSQPVTKRQLRACCSSTSVVALPAKCAAVPFMLDPPQPVPCVCMQPLAVLPCTAPHLHISDHLL